ncbi:MAG TPA: family 1 encapsulin nanocompartment shell protein [Alphaproteobacteria bacterium]|jgi:uncharacterized linocin/CFP29 family protein|nr:family 1 encapsulin nanocompartment shell protein [Alphaproteobacteria bacterium]
MDDLLRGLAPVADEAWAQIEAEAKRTLKITLAGRRVVDFKGPLGWASCAVDLGRADPLRETAGDDVAARLRRAQPLVELSVPFALSREELEAAARGADDTNLDPVIDAARKIAMAEDRAIFHGYKAAGITGVFEAADGNLELPKDYAQFPGVLAEAESQLRDAGVAGPYALVLSAEAYTGLTRASTPAGYPVLQHVRRLIDGPIVWAPGMEGALVISMRGGDFELYVGRDLSIGYSEHTAAEVRLYLQESLTFRVLGADAAVPIHKPRARRK